MMPCVLIRANEMFPRVPIGTNHMPPCVLVEEREKDSQTFGFAMKYFVNIYWSSLTAFDIFNTLCI